MAEIVVDQRAESASLYERDFYAWSQRQAAMLRAGHLTGVDLEHLAEEIEDMGREQRRAVRSQLRHLLVHLLKLRFSPATDPRAGWIDEIHHARAEVEDRLADSPSLASHLAGLFVEAWPRARRRAISQMEAHGELPPVPEDCPFTLEQALDDDYWPE